MSFTFGIVGFPTSFSITGEGPRPAGLVQPIEGGDHDPHQIALGYLLDIEEAGLLSPPAEQHDGYRWWPLEEMRASELVHPHTRAYLAAIERSPRMAQA